MKAESIAGIATPSVPDRVLSPGVQPNVNLGASVPFGTTKEVNIGFFTDLSSVSQADIDNNGLSRVHMVGSSISLGLLGKQARAWIGASPEIGHTRASPTRRSRCCRQALGSNYSFLE